MSFMAREVPRGVDHGRVQVSFDTSSKVLERLLPLNMAAGSSWSFVDSSILMGRERDLLLSENAGVLSVAKGVITDDSLLLPRIHFPTAQFKADALGKKILMPRSKESALLGLDPGKIENRETISVLHAELFLEATRALLTGNTKHLKLETDPDLLNYLLDRYLLSVAQRGDMLGQVQQAEDFRSRISEYVNETGPDVFQVVLTGMRARVLHKDQPFFMSYYGADDIIQRLLANSALPLFSRRMDQKFVWFRQNDANAAGYSLPPIPEDDALMQTYREASGNMTLEQVIKLYIDGELGARFLEKISKEERDAARKARLKAARDNTPGEVSQASLKPLKIKTSERRPALAPNPERGIVFGSSRELRGENVVKRHPKRRRYEEEFDDEY